MKREAVVCGGIASTFPPYPIAMKAAGLVFLSGIRAGSVLRTFVGIPEAGRVRQARRLMCFAQA